MSLWWWLAVVVAVVVVFLIVLFVVVTRLVRRQPYATFVDLPSRAKLRFFRAMLTDKRVPLYVKIIPVFTVAYLVLPFDLIPDFIPVIGYMDDVGIVILSLAAMMRLTPRPLIDQLLHEAAEGSGA